MDKMTLREKMKRILVEIEIGENPGQGFEEIACKLNISVWETTELIDLALSLGLVKFDEC